MKLQNLISIENSANSSVDIGIMCPHQYIYIYIYQLGFNLLRTTDGNCAVLNALKAAGMAPTVSLFLGERYITEDGEITFGGVNEALFEKDQGILVPIIGDDGHFTIQMYKFEFGKKVLCERGGPSSCTAVVDSGSAYIVGPKKIIDKINTKVISELFNKCKMNLSHITVNCMYL